MQSVVAAEPESNSARHRPFLARLDPADAAGLQALLRERELEPGAALLRAGAPGESVWLLLAGRVKVVARTATGREVVLGVAGPGDLVGEIGALDGNPRSADVVAVERVRAGRLTYSEVRSFLEERPSAALAFMRMLIQRMRDADRERVALVADDGFGRIATRLLELAERFGEPVEGGVRIELAMTQDELAGWTGASRVTVARALAQMRSLGWLSTSRRTITLLQLEAMRARGAGKLIAQGFPGVPAPGRRVAAR